MRLAGYQQPNVRPMVRWVDCSVLRSGSYELFREGRGPAWNDGQECGGTQRRQGVPNWLSRRQGSDAEDRARRCEVTSGDLVSTAPSASNNAAYACFGGRC